MVIPNFFIVGAPKCGTTALYDYLRTHPDIFLTLRKEVHYFSSVRYPNAINSLPEYMRLFAKCPETATAIGEASTSYLHDIEALRKIQQFNKEARIIIMLRNPVDMAHSYHQQMILQLWDDVKDFETAWRLQNTRLNGSNIPTTCVTPHLLQYERICSLGKQVEAALEIFPRNQVKVIIFDDFVKSTLDVYKETLSFLGLTYDGRRSFRRLTRATSGNMKR